MRLPIDTQSVKFAAAGPAEPVLDYETRLPKLDENATALFNVPFFAAGSGIKDSITVKVSGEPKGLLEFVLVLATQLGEYGAYLDPMERHVSRTLASHDNLRSSRVSHTTRRRGQAAVASFASPSLRSSSSSDAVSCIYTP